MSIYTVNASTLKHWIEDQETVVVDVREPYEHEAVHIASSTLLPLGSITRALLPPHEGKKLVLYCKAGVRSLRACEQLLREDPTLELYNLEGGIGAWLQLCPA